MIQSTSPDTKQPVLGQATMANSTPVTIASDQSAVPVSVVSLPLPAGASTEATLIKLALAQGSATSGQTGPLNQGAVTTAAPSYSTTQTSPLSLTTGGGLRTDTSSVAGTPTPTGNGVVGAGVQRVAIASDNTAFNVKAQLQDNAGTAITIGQKTMASSVPVVLASDQAHFPIELQDGSGNNITSTATAGTGSSKQALDVTLVPAAINYYSAPVNIRQSAATASGGTVWSMRNVSGSTKTVYIERIYLMMAFDTGTSLVTRTLQRYDLCRFSTATPTAGTAITVIKQDNSSGSTQVTDVRFVDTGLTTTSVAFEAPFATIGCPATDATTTQFVREGIAFKLAPGEGLCIRLNVTAVVGQDLTGEIVWSER